MFACQPAQAATWLNSVSATLQAKQAMPRSAQIRGVACVARVKLTVDGNGLIQSYAIVKPCASPILTRATDDVIFAVGQLPPPPARKPASFEIDLSWPPKG